MCTRHPQQAEGVLSRTMQPPWEKTIATRKHYTLGAFLEGLGDSCFHKITDLKGTADLCNFAAAENLGSDTKGKENCPEDQRPWHSALMNLREIIFKISSIFKIYSEFCIFPLSIFNGAILLTFNVHTIQLTYLKCTNLVFSLFVELCTYHHDHL